MLWPLHHYLGGWVAHVWVLWSVCAFWVLDSAFCAILPRYIYPLYAVLWPLHIITSVCLLLVGL